MEQMPTNLQAKVLISALPYIQKYTGKVVVVKYGGNAMINPELKRAVMSDIVLLSLIGVRVVLVHGGGPEITETLKALGKESRFIGGQRRICQKNIFSQPLWRLRWPRPRRLQRTPFSCRCAGRAARPKVRRARCSINSRRVGA